MKKILIINSNEETMALLEMWLERKQYDVKFTSHLEEVVEMLDEFMPDLIMIDIEQKGIIPVIKNYDRDIPLLVMTGGTYRGSYSDLSTDNKIEKPFNLELLEMKIGRLMKTAIL